MKKLKLLLASLIIVLTSCGKMSTEDIDKLSKDMPYKIRLTVNVSIESDPEILIRANDIEYNPEKREILVKGTGYVANRDAQWAYAIKVEDAKFSVPPAGKIEIEKVK